MNFFEFRSEIQVITLLFLPIPDLLKVESLFKGVDFSKLHYELLYSKNQGQLPFRLTKDLSRVLSKSVRIGPYEATDITTKLEKEKTAFWGTPLTDWKAGFAYSDGENAWFDLDKLLDGKRDTYWWSDGSVDQQKVDWLLFDLGGVGVVEYVDIKLGKDNTGAVWGFERGWLEFGFEEDNFHFKSKELFGVNKGFVHRFHKEKHFYSLWIAARYIKLWFQGCHQKQGSDAKWGFALESCSVVGRYIWYFPEPIPRILGIEKDHGHWSSS